MDFEEALRRYRPSGPPAELRDRVLGGESVGRPHQGRPVGRPFQGRRWREWSLALAAAVAAMTLYALTDATHRRVISATSPSDTEREAAIAEMAADLGGDEIARLEAERLITAFESAAVDPQGPFVIEEGIP